MGVWLNRVAFPVDRKTSSETGDVRVSAARRTRKMTFLRLMVRFILIGCLVGANVGLFFVFQEAKQAPAVTTVTGVALTDARLMGDGKDVAKVTYRWKEKKEEVGLRVASTVIAGDTVPVYINQVTGEVGDRTTTAGEAVGLIVFFIFLGACLGVIFALPFLDTFE